MIPTSQENSEKQWFENLQWNNLPCPLCGNIEAITQFTGPDRLMHLPGTFTVVRCTQCQLIRQNPRPKWNSLKHYYSDDYTSYAPLIEDVPSKLRQLDRRWGMYKLLKAVEKKQLGGKLLDIGCGTGIFIAEARKRGHWDIFGIEPSANAVEYAQSRLGETIFQGNFPNVSLDEKGFDVITMWHVVEHLEEPIKSFHTVNHYLRSGGWFIFAIPNLKSLDLKQFKNYWVGWDLPRHLYFFSEETIAEALDQAGFTIKHTQCLATTYNLLGHDLDFWSQSWATKFPRLAKWMNSLYNTFFIRVLLLMPFWFVGKTKKAPVITIFAQKSDM